MSKSLKFITRTAIMVALVTLLQWLGQVLGAAIPVIGPQLFTGSFVNMILALTVIFVGVWGAVIVGCLTPVMAFLIGQMKFPILMPFIAVGNIIFVVIIFLTVKLICKNEISDAVHIATISGGMAVGAVLKFLYMNFVLGMWLLPVLGLPEKVVPVMQASFGVTQLFTALIGSAIAVAVFIPLKKAVKPL